MLLFNQRIPFCGREEMMGTDSRDDVVVDSFIVALNEFQCGPNLHVALEPRVL